MTFNQKPRAAVERKAWAALIGGILAGAGLYVVDALTVATNDPQIWGGLPAPVQFVLTALVPGALSFAAAWLARHTPRQ